MKFLDSFIGRSNSNFLDVDQYSKISQDESITTEDNIVNLVRDIEFLRFELAVQVQDARIIIGRINKKLDYVRKIIEHLVKVLKIQRKHLTIATNSSKRECDIVGRLFLSSKVNHSGKFLRVFLDRRKQYHKNKIVRDCLTQELKILSI